MSEVGNTTNQLDVDSGLDKRCEKAFGISATSSGTSPRSKKGGFSSGVEIFENDAGDAEDAESCRWYLSWPELLNFSGMDKCLEEHWLNLLLTAQTISVGSR